MVGRYLKLRTGATDTVAAPGQRLTLTLDVTPGPKIHVYAPGQTGYISIALKMNESPDWRSAPAAFPTATPFVDPAGEHVTVYDQPFRVAQNITLTLTPSMRERGAARQQLVVSGAFEYQACDEKVCYRPETIPVQWTLALTPIEP